MKTVITVFISYAHKDKVLKDRLEEHLSNLKYRGLITTWHDREISAGDDWEYEINTHLERASIILLLISASFMASRYCYSIEMRRALERHEQGDVRVIPVLLRPVMFTDAPFAKLQLLPSNGKPVATWRYRDSAFLDVALGIERALQWHKKWQLPSDRNSSVVRSPFREESQLSEDPASRLPPPPARRRLRLAALISGIFLFLISTSSLWVYRFSIPLPNATSTGAMTPTATPTPRSTFVPPLTIINAFFIIITFCMILITLGMILARRRIQRYQEVQAYYQQALSAYEKALQHNHSDLAALTGKGTVLEALKQYSNAIDVFRQLAAHTLQAFPYTRIGDIFIKMNQAQDAIFAYEQAIRYDDQYAQAYYGLGRALARLGKTGEAEQAYEQAKQLGYED